jgi:non-ribosomal peptide synthetase component F
VDFNYPGPFIHQWIEAQVARTPAARAVVFGDERVSYAELNARANRLARHLRGLGAGPGALVGVCLERSADLVAARLAVLKSGAAYVPLDPSYPPAWPSCWATPGRPPSSPNG